MKEVSFDEFMSLTLSEKLDIFSEFSPEKMGEFWDEMPRFERESLFYLLPPSSRGKFFETWYTGTETLYEKYLRELEEKALRISFKEFISTRHGEKISIWPYLYPKKTQEFWMGMSIEEKLSWFNFLTPTFVDNVWEVTHDDVKQMLFKGYLWSEGTDEEAYVITLYKKEFPTVAKPLENSDVSGKF